MTALRAREFNFGRDYPEICEWWRRRGWPHIPKERLPYIGCTVESDEGKHCVGFLYFVEAGWALIEWVVSNPESPARTRRDAIALLVNELAQCAREGRASAVLSMTKSRGLARVFESVGFHVTDKEMIHVMRRFE